MLVRKKGGNENLTVTFMDLMWKLTNGECGLAWSVLLSTTIRVVKMLWTHEVQPSESATNFDHSDDAYHCR